ncbi:MAG TPA: inositol 2-dehydrogenase [Solirubrobacterales bacterium]|nr:inositol 2-dehydrogenase [Solirubrobacterales bacterium]
MAAQIVTTTQRIGVIGVGRIGHMHAELLAGQVPGAALGAVYDPVGERADATASQLGVRAVASVEDLLASDIDAVAICSPTDTHLEYILAAAEAGKGIFCEKPVSLDLAEVDSALAAVESTGVPFQVGFNRRFDPAHASVAAAVADGTVGEPHLVRITSRDPEPPPMEYVRHSGGLFCDMTIHDFDMARFVTGSEVVEVFARGAIRIDPLLADVGDIDTAVITLVHANRCLTTIDNSRQAVYGYDQRVEVFGSAGTAASDNALEHSGSVRTCVGALSAPLPYFFIERYTQSYVREWQAFVASLTTGAPPPVNGRDARAPLVIGLAALRSLREDRPVQIEEVESRV